MAKEDGDEIQQIFLNGWAVKVVTEKALGLVEAKGDRDVRCWLPKSKIDCVQIAGGGIVAADDVEKGDELDWIKIPQWLVEKNELESIDNNELDFSDNLADDDIPF